MDRVFPAWRAKWKKELILYLLTKGLQIKQLYKKRKRFPKWFASSTRTGPRSTIRLSYRRSRHVLLLSRTVLWKGRPNCPGESATSSLKMTEWLSLFKIPMKVVTFGRKIRWLTGNCSWTMEPPEVRSLFRKAKSGTSFWSTPKAVRIPSLTCDMGRPPSSHYQWWRQPCSSFSPIEI